MSTGKTYSTKYLLDTNNNRGSEGQVLISTSEGVNWSDGSDITGGPYLPLTAGASYPLTGDLYQTMGAIGVAQTDQDYIAKIYELNSDGFMSLYTGQPTPLERIRISSYGDSFFVPANNGNVGIGTTSPNGKLTIKDSGFGTAYNNYDALYIDNGSVTAGSGNYGNGIGFSRLGSQTYKKAAIAPVQGTSDSDNLGLAFFTSPNSGFADVVEEAMRINYNGNVGIGTTSPRGKLDVVGNTDDDTDFLTIQDNDTSAGSHRPSIRFRSDTAQIGQIVSLDNSMRFSVGTTEDSLLEIASSGNVGIGTTSPSYKLDVNSASAVGARISTTGFTNLDLVSSRTSGNLGGLRFKQDIDAAQTGEFLGLHGGGFDWKVGNGSVAPVIKMRLDSSGNLGIGTTSPGLKLDVNGDIRGYGSVRVNSAADGDPYFALYQNGTEKAYFQYVDSGDNLVLQSDGIFTFKTATAERVRITAGGRVGIGVTNPSAKLQVEDSANNIQMRVGSLTAGRSPIIRLQGKNSANTTNYYADIELDAEDGKLIFNDPGTSGGSVGQNPMALDSSGNVGIGTTSPDSLLHIKGADPVFIIQDTSTGTADASSTLRLGESGAGGVLDTYWDIKQAADAFNTHLEINHSSNGNHLTILDGGNVGIGTTSPDAKLDVQPTASNRKVTKIANDVKSAYFYSTQADAVLAWTCGSYYQAEVVITASQTNGGTYNNIYIRGIWSNNHTSHHWDELERVGFLTGSTFTMSVGQNGATTNSGRLELDFNYISGSFAQLNVRVTDFYGTHSYTIT